MLKNRSVSLLVLILSAGIVLGIVLSNTFTTKTVEAQQINNPKWEYCRVSKRIGRDNFGKGIGYADIEYFQYPAIRKETITIESNDSPTVDEDALSRAFQRLGELGWEMAQVDRREVDSTVSYYFKRLKR
jgi:hypothetical protein